MFYDDIGLKVIILTADDTALPADNVSFNGMAYSNDGALYVVKLDSGEALPADAVSVAGYACRNDGAAYVVNAAVDASAVLVNGIACRPDGVMYVTDVGSRPSNAAHGIFVTDAGAVYISIQGGYYAGGFMLQESEFFVFQEDGSSKIIYE